MSTLTLCADDFGLSKTVNDGIIALIKKSRLNAVSCMSVGKHISDAERLIKAATNAPHPVELGLHLTLTEYAPLIPMRKLAPENQFPSIGSLIIKSHLRQLDLAEIAAEVQKQVDTFEVLFGHKPQFIDGHQHAHILPGIRDIVLRYGSADCWIRQCSAPRTSILNMRVALPRTLLISTLSRKLKAKLRSKNIPHHDQFFGVNDFNTDENFAKLMDKWLYQAAKRSGKSLIMCHPGFEATADEATIHDLIRNRRPQEYAHLASEQFLFDMNKYGLSL